MAERITIEDETFFGGYANHIQRYEFASAYCRDGDVLDAGCGTGYGSSFLARGIAADVAAVDVSEEALAEARRLYSRPNLRFLRGDVEDLAAIADLGGPFDVIVNLENIEHLENPERFLNGASAVLKSEGCFVVSSPNGELTERDAAGKIRNRFHVREFTVDELRALLAPHSRSIEMFGQWATPQRKARIINERRQFDLLCDLYYDPFARVGRAIRRLARGKRFSPPVFVGEGTSLTGDFVIGPIDSPPFAWAPEVILAVARR